MGHSKALLGYQQRVAQDKQRIKNLMLEAPKGVQAAWAKTKTTTRFSLGRADRLAARDVTCAQHVLFELALFDVKFDFAEGLMLQMWKSDTISGDKRLVNVGSKPRMVHDDVFICVDMVDPFTAGEGGKLQVNVVVYSGAAENGYWLKGTSVSKII